MGAVFPERLVTDRLRFRAAGPESIDHETLYEAYSGPGLERVMAHVPLEPYETRREVLEFLESVAEGRAENRAATYAIYPREGEDGAGELAGTTTLFVDWECRRAGLAIVLRERFWGRGYSGERAGALLAVAFDRLDLEVVGVSCLPANENSRRAISRYVERYGGCYDGRHRNARTLDDEPVDLHRYSITREQYREAEPALESVDDEAS